MNAKKIYSKTLLFVWLKLALGGVTILASIILLAICLGLGLLIRNTGMLFVFMIIWLVGAGYLNFLINQYFGYMVKAGHIAVVAQAVTTGALPENQLEYAKEKVKERFITGSVFFVVDRLVSGAVSQLQKGVDTVGNVFGNIPGVSGIVSFAKVFIGISLGYVDECCLGYTFYHQDQSVYKSAADGVVIYFQNWKKLLKNAALMTVIVMVAVFFSWLLSFGLIGGIFSVFKWNMLIAFIIAVFLAMTLKTAFVDSYMMVSMMVSYMEEAPNTEITFDLYSKLCKLSNKFKSLFEKGETEEAGISQG